MIPPVGQPVLVEHAVLPLGARLWGAGRPAYPDEPPLPEAVEAGVREWRESGVDFVVSLIEDWEIPRRAPGLFDAVSRRGIGLVRFPVVDFGAPTDVAVFAEQLAELRRRLARGEGILVHCNAGLGRTAVVLASLLKIYGLDSDPVAEIRRVYRANAMERPTQEAFVRGLPASPNGEPRGR